MSQKNFLGKNTEEMVAAAKADQGKKTEVFYKGAAQVQRKVRLSGEHTEVVEQTTFATGTKEGILPDKHSVYS